MKAKDLLALSPAYQIGKKIHKGDIPGLGLLTMGIAEHGKRKRKKKKKKKEQTDVGQVQKYNRGGLVSKSGIINGYKKGGQV